MSNTKNDKDFKIIKEERQTSIIEPNILKYGLEQAWEMRDPKKISRENKGNKSRSRAFASEFSTVESEVQAYQDYITILANNLRVMIEKGYKEKYLNACNADIDLALKRMEAISLFVPDDKAVKQKCKTMLRNVEVEVDSVRRFQAQDKQNRVIAKDLKSGNPHLHVPTRTSTGVISSHIDKQTSRAERRETKRNDYAPLPDKHPTLKKFAFGDKAVKGFLKKEAKEKSAKQEDQPEAKTKFRPTGGS